MERKTFKNIDLTNKLNLSMIHNMITCAKDLPKRK